MSSKSILYFFLIFWQFFPIKINAQCRPKQFPAGIVCVCDANFCDEFPPIGNLSDGQAAIYVTSGEGKRFERTSANFEEATDGSKSPITIRLNPSQKYQSIIGFGGAFTDSAGFNMNRLSQKAREKLLRAYFAEEGIGYTIARVIMASCDFSPRVYSYNDLYQDPLQCPILETPIKCLLSFLNPLLNTKTDFELEHFNLTSEDFSFKIPHIKAAMELMPAGERLKLFATPFSAPAWMKWTGYMEGGGPLRGEVDGPYYRTWAKYFMRYFEDYAKEGVHFWGLTMQNEPRISVIPIWWQGTSFTAEQQRDFLKLWLGPALKNSELTKELKVLIMDDQRTFLPSFPNIVLADKEAAKYVDGIGLHWYFDSLTAPEPTLVATHNAHPDKFMIGTEASQGYLPGQGPSLGDWSRAENYAENIMQNLQNWVTGWTEWNLCLDEKGGPTWVTTVIHGLDATIIVNNTADEFYKQPMYYAIGHFSKFIRPGSQRIEHKITMEDSSKLSNLLKMLNAVAFVTPTNQTGLVVYNKNAIEDYELAIFVGEQKLKFKILHKSIATIIWDNF